MEDEDKNSKSLVLITRVGSTPTTGIKKKRPQLVWGSFLFYLRRVSGSNSTALLCRASDQPCGLSLSARETPTTGIKKRTSPACLGEFSFLSAACERVEQHGPALQGERSALRAVAQCAGAPHHRHKKEAPSACLGEFSFLSAACEHDLVVCIGRDRHAGLHHFQPVHEKIVEKYRMMTLPIS